MKYVIVVKEVKEIYHQIEIDTEDDKLINQVAAGIDMGDFDDIDSVADYVDEIIPVDSVDNICDEITKEFWCEEVYLKD